MAQATATKIYEHDGKKYRLADKRDIGKTVYVDDDGFDRALAESNILQCELGSIDPARGFPFKAKTGSRWAYAFVELEEPVPAVVPFNGTLEVGQWYETNNGDRFYCNSRTHHDTYPMVMVEKDGCVTTYTENGLFYEDDDKDALCSIALQLVGCTGFDWTKPVPPAVVPEPEPVDTRPKPPAGWRYVAEDDVLVEGDVYMNKTGDMAGSVWTGKGSAVSKLKAGGSWHNNWVGVIRKLPSPEAPEPNFETSWLNTMCETIHAKQKATGWWDAADNPLVVPTKIALIVSECAEALEGHRRDAMDDKLTHRKALDTELADVFIRLCDLAGFLKVPLGTIVAEKEAYNASRADHKPENRKAVGGKRY